MLFLMRMVKFGAILPRNWLRRHRLGVFSLPFPPSPSLPRCAVPPSLLPPHTPTPVSEEKGAKELGPRWVGTAGVHT